MFYLHVRSVDMRCMCGISPRICLSFYINHVLIVAITYELPIPITCVCYLVRKYQELIK